MAAPLTCNQNKSDKFTKYLEGVQHMGLEVRGLDVNESFTAFSANRDGVIRSGLGGISHVGLSAAEATIKEHKEQGAYQDVYDFSQRTDLTNCSRRALEVLILSGTFDSFGIDREAYFAPIAKSGASGLSYGKDETFLTAFMQYGKTLESERTQVQASLFGDSDPSVKLLESIPPKDVEPWSNLERLTKERSYIGMYLSAHLLDPYTFAIEYLCNCLASDLAQFAKLGLTQLTCAGLVTKVRQGINKKNEPYTVVQIEDASGSGEIPSFGRDYANFGNFVQGGSAILVEMGAAPSRFDPNRLYRTVQSMQLLSDITEGTFRSIQLTIDLSQGGDAPASDPYEEGADGEEEILDRLNILEGIIELGNAIKDHPGKMELEVTFCPSMVPYTTTMYAPSIEPGKWLLGIIKEYQIQCAMQQTK